MADFDPFRDGGAAVLEDAPEEFDPFKSGAIPLNEDFDPFKSGAIPLDDGGAPPPKFASFDGIQLTPEAGNYSSDMVAARAAHPLKENMGFMETATTAPFPIPRIGPQEGTLKQIGAGSVNALAALAESITSPLGLASLPLGGAPAAVQKGAAVLFAADQAKSIPQSLRAVADAEGLQQTVEAGLGLAGNIAIPGAVGRHVLGPKIPGEVTQLRKAPLSEGAPATAEIQRVADTGNPATAKALVEADAAITEAAPPTLPETAPPKGYPISGEAGPPVAEPPLLSNAPEPVPPATLERPLVEGEQGGATAVDPAISAREGAVPEAGSVAEGSRITEAPTAIEATSQIRPPLTPREGPVETSSPSVSELALPEGSTTPQVEIPGPRAPAQKKSVYALGISPDNKAAKWVVDNAKRLMTAEGDLPKETFNRWVERTGEVKADSRQIAYATRDLYDGLRKEFGITRMDEVKSGLEKVPREFVTEMNDALLGKRDINSLPETVREPVQRMRDHIDTLSQRMLNDGIVPEKLQAAVSDNLGVYMTRSYRVFDDPKWAESIPVETRNRAKDFILSDLRRDNPAATPEQAHSVMQTMLQDWKDQGSGVLIKGGKMGSKDLSSFIARKDIPEVLRDFMGEYKNPVINYARSVTKMAHLIANSHFLNDVRAQGLGKFLFEDGTQPATHTARIAADESAVMSPLNGLRTTPEIATAFREFGKSEHTRSALTRAYFTLSGIAKAGKTVGSVMTQARNLFGQTYFWLMNGHFDPRSSGVAVKSILADIGATNSKKARETYNRYLKLGIVDQSPKAGELRDVISAAGLNDADVNRLDTQGHITKALKRYTLDAATTAYRVSDDLGKIVGFENELARLKKIDPTKPVEALEQEAAQRIRNTYPTYSAIPEWLKQFQKQPIFGPFTSFAYESFRTAFHNLRYTAEDLRSSNPEAKKAGAQRLAGQLAVLGGGYALSTASRAMLGLMAEDEDDARRFMPPWDKNAQLLFTGKEDGKATYVNISYTNPYSYMTDPINAVATGIRNDEELLDLMGRSFMELIRPFASESILANAGLDIQRNATETGRKVYNPQDTPDEKIRAVLAHVGEAIEPGTSTRLRKKIIPSLKGEQTATGTALSPTNEITSELLGFKTQTLDYEQALAFKASRFRKNDADAEGIFTNIAMRRGTVEPDDITDSYKRSNEAKFNLWKELHGDVQAARRRGVSANAIRETLVSGGLTKADAGNVITGKFAPYVVGKESADKLRRLNRVLPSEVSAEAQRSRSLVLSGSFEP